MYKVAIFDLDGTLADTLESIAYTCNACLKQVGLVPIPSEAYKAFTGDGTEALVRKATRAAGDIEGKTVAQVLKLYTEMFAQNCTYKVRPYEGIQETLQILKEKGLKLAVLTNKKQERAVMVIEHLFGKNMFDLIIGQSDRFPVKPNPTSAEWIAKQFSCKTDECIFVGDTEIDVQTGQNAGMLTVGVLWGFRDREILDAANPDQTIEKPDELVNLL
ncbi:HAD family hydrolase [Caldifermentibacillus hisashii]|uniref:HAD family hydrolase n=1 Tax=Caldifermentibacillus hisashii TaxID=996558 RepID=UPI0031FC60FB